MQVGTERKSAAAESCGHIEVIKVLGGSETGLNTLPVYRAKCWATRLDPPERSLNRNRNECLKARQITF